MTFRVHVAQTYPVGLSPFIEHLDGLVVRSYQDRNSASQDIRVPRGVGTVDHVRVVAMSDATVVLILCEHRRTSLTQPEGG